MRRDHIHFKRSGAGSLDCKLLGVGAESQLRQRNLLNRDWNKDGRQVRSDHASLHMVRVSDEDWTQHREGLGSPLPKAR